MRLTEEQKWLGDESSNSTIFGDIMKWVTDLYPRKVKKPVFKGFFYYSRTSPVEHKKLNKNMKVMDWKQSIIKVVIG